jgi:hypothetical protein
MPAIAPPLAISPEDLHTLGQWRRSGSIRAALVERAKIVLLPAQGLSNTEIARRVGCSRPTVILWRRRYAQHGLDGLGDRPRPGRPQTVRADRRAEILAPPPEHLPATPLVGVIRPGIAGGSDPWRGWSHVSTEEVPPRAS